MPANLIPKLLYEHKLQGRTCYGRPAETISILVTETDQDAYVVCVFIIIIIIITIIIINEEEYLFAVGGLERSLKKYTQRDKPSLQSNKSSILSGFAE
jgi:hypothetical protein